MQHSRIIANRSCVLAVLATMSAFCLASNIAAQAPTTLNYQGRLLQNTTDQGAASGPVDIDFSIWTGPSSDGDAIQLWTESWTGVALSNGIFSVLLGSNGTPLDPADFQGDDTLFLELEIDGETLLPRQQLGSVPFAMVDEPGNELQDLDLVGNTLSLSGDPTTVDLSPLLDNTDEQDLSLIGNSLVLTNDPTPTPIDLSPYLDDTTVDNQVLSLSGNTLGLTSDDGTDQVDLSIYLDGTDPQDLASVLAQGADAEGASMTGMGTVEGNASEADASSEDAAFSGPGPATVDSISSLWQSWTAENDGFLTRIDLRHPSNGFSGTLEIREGQGAGAPLLLQETAGGGTGWAEYALGTPVAVTAGQQYTVRLITEGGGSFNWRASNSDSYAGGRSSVSSTWDFLFKTYVTRPPSLDLSSGGVQVVASALKPANDAATDLGSGTNRWRDVYASNGIIQTSDARLKSDVEESPYGLDEVLALQPIAFRWAMGGEDRRLGFLAQQVEPLLPEAVTGGPSHGAAYGMSYAALVPVLTRAIQELQVLIDLQAERIDLQAESIEEFEAALRGRREAER